MHKLKHPEPQPDCFACKLQTINWGIVPGAYRDVNSASMYDREALKDFPTNEETQDRKSDALRKLNGS